MASETLLGLFDGYMPLGLDRLTSETKLGGTPVFFPELSEEQQRQIAVWTTCGVCGHKMFLLLQAYSPLPSMEAPTAGGAAAAACAPPPPNDKDPSTATAATATSSGGWNRMLYVFACNSSSCARQPSDSWAAFSLQVDRADVADLHDNSEDDEDEDDAALEQPLPRQDLPPHTFPPCFVYVDAEPATEVIVPTDVEREMAKMAEANAQVDGNGIREEDLAELEQMVDLKDKKSDYYYEKFRSRLARAPMQVLRYHQRPCPPPPPPPPPPPQLSNDTNIIATDDATTTTASTVAAAASGAKVGKEQRPLFMNPDKAKRFLTVPACTACGAALVHELQLMPTVVFFLRASAYVHKKEAADKKDEKDVSEHDDGSDGTSTVPPPPPADSNKNVGVAVVKAPSITTAGGVSDEASSSAGSGGSPHGRNTNNTNSNENLKSSGDDGVDFGTMTVYVCSKDCAAQHRGGAFLRREVVRVEEPPSLRDDRVEADAEGGKRDLRQMLEDGPDGEEGEEGT